MPKDKETKSAVEALGSQELSALKPDLTTASDNKQVTFTLAELNAIVQTSVEGAVKSAAVMFAEAMKESKIPYVDPKKAENDKIMKESERRQLAIHKANLEISQKDCPHLQACGTNSQEAGTKTCIAWHKYETGDILGFCQNCQRRFLPSDSDYMYQLQRKHSGSMSGSGTRQWRRAEETAPFYKQ